jgi:phosphoglycolate phosphatase-like HAD superfamily hydrolase
MKLVVFDFDGTLARTDGVDGECFTQALEEALQLRDFSTEWTDYEHVTDEGVTRQIFMEHFGRHPHDEERKRVIEHFVGLLNSRCAANNLEFSEVPGAASLVNQLREGGEWAVALATGAWRRSVEFKIQRAGLPITDIPSAFAEDGPSRESIVLTAIERASAHYRQQRFERIISLGDALWDVRTARKLGLPFLGIAEEPRASALRKDGASHVIEDYRNVAQCLQYFAEARRP